MTPPTPDLTALEQQAAATWRMCPACQYEWRVPHLPAGESNDCPICTLADAHLESEQSAVARAEQAERERDEARASVATGFTLAERDRLEARIAELEAHEVEALVQLASYDPDETVINAILRVQRHAESDRDAARAEVAQARAERDKAREAEGIMRGTPIAFLHNRITALEDENDTLRAELQAAQSVLTDVRPMLCDILKLCSDVGAGNDYEAVARVIVRIDALQANHATARETDLGAADAPQSRADAPREDRTVPSSTVEGLAEHQSLSFSEGER